MDETLLRLVLPDGPADRLDKALARALPEGAGLSRSRLQRLIAEGCVTGPGGVMRDAKAQVPGGAAIELRVPLPAPLDLSGEDIPLEIAYEDADLIVVDKPAGMVVHPAPGAGTGTLVQALIHHCGASLSGIGGVERPGIVHRIDKDTSGLLVVAKTDLAHQGLAAQFAAHSVGRRYRALCWGAPDAADPRLRGLAAVRFAGPDVTIDAPLDRHRSDRKKMAVVPTGRRAVTHMRVQARFGAGARPVAAEIQCELETGRTHQIRVHMAHIGHALVGDPVYGRARAVARGALGADAVAALRGFPRQALHAETLEFEHPVSKERLAFRAAIPEDFKELLGILRASRWG